MTATLIQIFLIFMVLELLNVCSVADTKKFSERSPLNVKVIEEMENSVDRRNFRVNEGPLPEVEKSTKVLQEVFIALGINGTLRSTKEMDSGLNVIAPEEVGHLEDSIVADYDKEIADNESGQAFPSDSDLNLGVPGNLEPFDLYAGDIILNAEQAEDWNIRKAVRFDWNLWPMREGTPTIHYATGNTKVPTSVIEESIAHYEEHTCIRFHKAWFIHIGPKIVFNGGSGCSSMVGRQFLNFFGGQDIILAEGCGTIPTVVHEIGHAVGLYHEQSRSDRDGYIKVISSNIKSGLNYNFNKQSTNNYETSYDYFSVMHYGPLSFSSNGDTTLAATDPMAEGLMILSRSGLSFMDKLLLNRMYGCVDKWVSQCSEISSDPCKNMGYLGPDCNCVCPAGTSGDNCQTKTKSYTEGLIEELLPLNERVLAQGLVSSPNYPEPQTPATVFTKIIEAPSCQIVKLTVSGFDLHQRYASKRCSSEGVEIRLGDPITSGKWYCGSELKVGDTFKSESNTIVLFYIKAKKTSNSNAGFSFDVTFQQDPSC